MRKNECHPQDPKVTNRFKKWEGSVPSFDRERRNNTREGPSSETGSFGNEECSSPVWGSLGRGIEGGKEKQFDHSRGLPSDSERRGGNDEDRPRGPISGESRGEFQIREILVEKDPLGANEYH